MLKMLLLLLLAGPGPAYNLTFTSSIGTVVPLANFKGRKILIVNTATGSALATQIAGLQTLYQQYKNELVIIAFPSNDFGHEPMNDSAVSQTLTFRYGVQFIVGTKTSVSGQGQNNLYRWLTDSTLNGRASNTVGNDFYKFLIDGSGNWVGVFSDAVDPMAPELVNAIKE